MKNMAQDKRQVDAITSRDTDFAQWYTDVCKKAELIDYTSTKGMFVLRPYGYAIWENIQRILDGEFKKTGHTNVSMPLLIPESLLQKEKDHVSGFAPECAWVTMGGSEELEEKLCIRPTSETLFCDHWSRVVQSWRDLPMLYNQWCSVLRWEKTSRPFLRHREFLWQEGHTLHATSEEAVEETEQQLECYAAFCEDSLAMPVIRGRKTEKEKFAGAESTYTIECMMHDHKALQGGTSHYFGDGFAKAFDITFTDKNNRLTNPFETSWGLSTRIIGGLIMTHGDDNGLVLPPKVAPIQAVVIPVAMHKEGVLAAAEALRARLADAGLRVKLDDSDNSPGWKFAEYEMKGVPLRVEIGPKDIEKGQCVAARRDTGEKIFIPLSELETAAQKLLNEIHDNLYAMALKNREDNTFDIKSPAEAKTIAEGKGGFLRSKWCGEAACEVAMKEQAGVTSRCMPLVQSGTEGVCPVCGKSCKTDIFWGVAY
jgi:prolyl-tRNA synthetase